MKLNKLFIFSFICLGLTNCIVAVDTAPSNKDNLKYNHANTSWQLNHIFIELNPNLYAYPIWHEDLSENGSQNNIFYFESSLDHRSPFDVQEPEFNDFLEISTDLKFLRVNQANKPATVIPATLLNNFDKFNDETTLIEYNGKSYFRFNRFHPQSFFLGKFYHFEFYNPCPPVEVDGDMMQCLAMPMWRPTQHIAFEISSGPSTSALSAINDFSDNPSMSSFHKTIWYTDIAIPSSELGNYYHGQFSNYTNLSPLGYVNLKIIATGKKLFFTIEPDKNIKH